MPWRFKKHVYLICLGAIALALAVTVLIRNRSLDDDLLAYLGLVGGLAIVINELPENGRSGEG